MNRRQFFARLGGAFAAALASPALLKLSPATPSLGFCPDAMADCPLGISIRYMRKFSLVESAAIPRLDVIYGLPSVDGWSATALELGDYVIDGAEGEPDLTVTVGPVNT